MEAVSYYLKPDRGTWSEPCVCGRDIRVPDVPVDKTRWTPVDWESVGRAVRNHQATPEHVAYRMGYRARVLPHTMSPDGLPVVGGLE